jgi:hypothetical protein
MLADIVGQQLNSCQQLSSCQQINSCKQLNPPFMSILQITRTYDDEQSTDWLLKKQSGVNKYLVLGREYERKKGNRREFFPSPEQSRTPSCII